MFGLRAFSISNPKMKKKNEFKNNTQIPPPPPKKKNQSKTKNKTALQLMFYLKKILI